MVETLNELAQLRNTRFGRPWPRHGLKLLYWFANECISFENNNMLSECDPAEGDFGFHYFENRHNQYGNKLLPETNFHYYVIGNLNSPGAEELPNYVSEDDNTDEHDSNTDRIIVSLDEDWFDQVYVTQHNNRSNYDPHATYRISRGLLMIIRRMSLEDLLQEMGYYAHTQPVINYRAATVSSSDSSANESVIQLDDDTPAQNNSNNIPATWGLWETLCTIL
ncbi:uncharacterized protein LOC131528379 [Onychostoma macrolepis]|uniref:uncharacterized protein LOC131528379 n=1 Tax=Onychostoma macrolepis TaxID=369639 RepID=UPI00272A4981|nr:uncharacterized protein LOC131528379 [Onychostoma macrolepis]XP_058613545.1 uncharacterized protein LOC131528379 [Onychostoma macrolepis]XP_058613629.1 uncharacterized protein LOC131528379 [Onychostoma macrolepis]